MREDLTNSAPFVTGMRKIGTVIVLLALLWPLSYLVRGGQEREKAQLAYVIDGDTIAAKGKDRRMRLFGVDAAEINEGGGPEAKYELQKILTGGCFEYVVVAQDKYGRDVVRIWAGGREVNRTLIDEGIAKEYCRYSRDLYGNC